MEILQLLRHCQHTNPSTAAVQHLVHDTVPPEKNRQCTALSQSDTLSLWHRAVQPSSRYSPQATATLLALLMGSKLAVLPSHELLTHSASLPNMPLTFSPFWSWAAGVLHHSHPSHWLEIPGGGHTVSALAWAAPTALCARGGRVLVPPADSAVLPASRYPGNTVRRHACCACCGLPFACVPGLHKSELAPEMVWRRGAGETIVHSQQMHPLSPSSQPHAHMGAPRTAAGSSTSAKDRPLLLLNAPCQLSFSCA